MGELFNKLDHKEELGAWIAYYGGTENSYRLSKDRAASLETLMRYWESNKADYLYDLLGKKFIVEREISFELPLTSLVDKMYTQLFSEEMSEFYRNYTDWVDSYEVKGEIGWRQYVSLKSLVKPDVLAENKYDGELVKLVVNGTPIAIQNGCKPSKILRKIAEAANLEGFERFRIAHSNVLANRFQKGTLCLSIHPLDYITMSDNTYDWDSCMNWRDAGCYRIGTVEMMNSPCVVVAYVKGRESMRYGEFEWNSKKWRNLFIVTKDFICGIKGYPYQSSKFDEVCIETLRDLAEKNLHFSYCENIVEHDFDYQIGKIYIDELDRTVKFKFETTYMYSDFGNSNTSHLIVSPNIPDVVACNYSGLPICMYCGEELSCDNYDSHDCSYVMCESCSPNLKCENCGERIDPDDVFELDGMTFCCDCYYSHRVYDPFDCDYHYDGNMRTVYLVSNTAAIEKGYSTKEETLNWYRDFVDVFPQLMIHVSSFDSLPIQEHRFPKRRDWFDESYVWIIDLDTIEDESLKEDIVQTFREYGE